LNLCFGLGGFFESDPKFVCPHYSLGPNGDLGVGVLSSHRGADWDKVGDAFARKSWRISILSVIRWQFGWPRRSYP